MLPIKKEREDSEHVDVIAAQLVDCSEESEVPSYCCFLFFRNSRGFKGFNYLVTVFLSIEPDLC